VDISIINLKTEGLKMRKVRMFKVKDAGYDVYGNAKHHHLYITHGKEVIGYFHLLDDGNLGFFPSYYGKTLEDIKKESAIEIDLTKENHSIPFELFKT
jgi:hypothetical protein